jgi:ribosomal protein L37E
MEREMIPERKEVTVTTEYGTATFLVPVNKPVCPRCGSQADYREGECVDVGWGDRYGVQVEPDHCAACGWIDGVPGDSPEEG